MKLFTNYRLYGTAREGLGKINQILEQKALNFQRENIMWQTVCLHVIFLFQTHPVEEQ